MLKKFKVTNYKNFKDSIEIDFSDIGGYQFNKDCIHEDMLSKIIIYGRNATGKTNLGKAILDIFYTTFLPGNPVSWNRDVLNANSNDNIAQFLYVFQIEKSEVEYRYEKNRDGEVVFEELLINDKQVFLVKEGEVSEYNKELINLNQVHINNYNNITKNFEKANIEASSFFRWITNNIEMGASPVVFDTLLFIIRMTLLETEDQSTIQYSSKEFVEELLENNNLGKFEEFLNYMGVDCKLKIGELPDGSKQLYFKHERLISFFENASSGTIGLANVYKKFILKRRELKLIFIDEFDAFYHYELSERMVEYFKEKYDDCQVILTTHNTNLINNSLMRPDAVFILSREGKLTPLSRATNRELREGHNLEKMYISGEFESYE